MIRRPLAALVFVAPPAAATAAPRTAYEVPPGQSARQTTDSALPEQGARVRQPPGAGGSVPRASPAWSGMCCR